MEMCGECCMGEPNGGVESDDGLGEYMESEERKEEQCGTTMCERELGVK